MSKALSLWVPKVAAKLPLCPDQVIEAEALDICRDFCQETRLWDEQPLTAMNIVATQADYTLTSASGVIVAVDLVHINNNPIDPTTPMEEDVRNRYWRDASETLPRRFYVQEDDVISLVYTPDTSYDASTYGGIEVWCALKPLETATTVEDFLWETFEDCIREGILGRLYDMDGSPWYNPQLAIFHNSMYEGKRDTAKFRKFHGRTKKEVIATRTAPFFA